MFRRIKLTGKIVGSIVATLAVTSAISFWITQRRVNQQAEEAFRDKVRQITGMAAATRIWFSENIDTMVPGRDFKHLSQVPVVVAWSVAQQYANAQDMEFHTPSLSPRNPKNQPDEFERRALEAFQRDPAMKEFSERRMESGKEFMRYAQPVRITQDCLMCHGYPVGEKDPFGFSKEGMQVGDLRGAFVVRASTEQLLRTAGSNSIAIFLTSFLTLLAGAGVVFVLVRKLVVKPLSASVQLAHHIAGNNLAVDDLPVEAEDEIGEATSALNTMKNSLRDIIQCIAATAEHLPAPAKRFPPERPRPPTDGVRRPTRYTRWRPPCRRCLRPCSRCQRAPAARRRITRRSRTSGAVRAARSWRRPSWSMRELADSTRARRTRSQELGKSGD